MRPRRWRTHGIHGWWFYPEKYESMGRIFFISGKSSKSLKNHQPDWFSRHFLRIPRDIPPISSRSSRLASSLRIQNITTWKLGSAVPVMSGYIYIYIYITISGWWYTYPSEKYESVGMITPNIWKS